MNTATRRKSLRFWAPVGLGAAAAGAVTAVLLGTVMLGPDAAPAGERVPATPVSIIGDAPPTACFRGDHRWRADLVGDRPCASSPR